MATNSFALALHGGAGTIAPGNAADEAPYRTALLQALAAGRAALERGGSALDAVIASVVSLEDCPLFNRPREAGPAWLREAGPAIGA